MKTMVVISNRYPLQRRLRRALTEDGWDVFRCPGPPLCGVTEVCPLAKTADAIVYDTDVGEPTQAWPALIRILAIGVPVVVLVPHDDVQAWIGDKQHMLVLPRDASAERIIERLHGAARRHLKTSEEDCDALPAYATVG